MTSINIHKTNIQKFSAGEWAEDCCADSIGFGGTLLRKQRKTQSSKKSSTLYRLP